MLRRVGGILTIVPNATKGSRNSKVYWAAKRFEEMIMSGLIDRGSVDHHLFNIAQLSGLDGNERRFEDTVRQPVVTQELADVFDRLSSGHTQAGQAGHAVIA